MSQPSLDISSIWLPILWERNQKLKSGISRVITTTIPGCTPSKLPKCDVYQIYLRQWMESNTIALYWDRTLTTGHRKGKITVCYFCHQIYYEFHPKKLLQCWKMLFPSAFNNWLLCNHMKGKTIVSVFRRES